MRAEHELYLNTSWGPVFKMRAAEHVLNEFNARIGQQLVDRPMCHIISIFDHKITLMWQSFFKTLTELHILHIHNLVKVRRGIPTLEMLEWWLEVTYLNLDIGRFFKTLWFVTHFADNAERRFIQYFFSSSIFSLAPLAASSAVSLFMKRCTLVQWHSTLLLELFDFPA